MTENATMNVQTKLSLHGSSSSSSRHALTTLSISMKDENDSKLEYLVYASHGIINLATASTISDPHNPTTITNVQQTLRSSRKNKEAIITALTRIDSINIVTSEELYILAAGYSNGGISLWWYSPQNNKTANKTSEWKEIILLECASNESISSTTSSTNSITDISGIYHSHLRLFVLATATAHGLTIYQSPMQTLLQNSFTESNTPVPTDEYKVQHIAKCGSLASVLVTTRIIPYCFKLHDGHKDTTNVETLIFCGTALPRHNKVWVYSSISSSIKEPTSFLTHGNLIGHEDWITCLAWKPLLNSSISISSSSESIVEPDYFLASGSHDAKIRLWKFQPSTTSISVEENEDNEEEEDENDDDDDDDDDDEYHDDNGSDDDEILDTILEEEGEARLVLKHLINNSSIAISLEALLIGHEESITSLSWKPSTAYSSKEDDTDDLCIVSSSMDKAILLWSPDDAEEGIWIPSSRVGSAGGILGGSIGSSLLGYLNVTFWNTQSKDLMMVGVGFGGSIHFWKLVSSDVSSLTEEAKQDMVTSSIMGVDEEQVWEALPCLTGHFKGVSDLDWETVSGEYLLTVSYDQTCRVWSEVHVESNNGESIRWMEVGRPQVHGYDLNAITCMGGDGSVDGRSEPRYRFVSGADEKQLRAFDAPVMTLRLVHGLQNRNSTWEGEKEKLESNSRVERAYIPSLGLSNKGMLPTSEHNDESNGEVEIPTSNQGESNSIPPLPLERDLGVTTLWPEVRKLYGHESELVCLASTSLTKRSNGEILVASACKARDVENAAIRLWNVESGICVGVLKGGHRSTVATLSFSADGSFLASSGKDRRLCIWKKTMNPDSEEMQSYSLAAAVDTAHKRIIWSVDFCSYAPSLLASGGRDGIVKIWRIEEKEDHSCELKELLRFEPLSKEDGKKNVSVTAVAFTPLSIKSSDDKENAVIAIGLENGLIELWSISLDTLDKAELLQQVCYSDCHIAAVKKLAWRPCKESLGEEYNLSGKKFTLASCGLDHGVRIFDIFFG